MASESARVLKPRSRLYLREPAAGRLARFIGPMSFQSAGTMAKQTGSAPGIVTAASSPGSPTTALVMRAALSAPQEASAGPKMIK